MKVLSYCWPTQLSASQEVGGIAPLIVDCGKRGTFGGEFLFFEVSFISCKFKVIELFNFKYSLKEV